MRRKNQARVLGGERDTSTPPPRNKTHQAGHVEIKEIRSCRRKHVIYKETKSSSAISSPNKKARSAGFCLLLIPRDVARDLSPQ